MGQNVVGQNVVGQDVTGAISLGQDVVGQDVGGAGRRGAELRGAGRRWGKISGAGGHGAEGSGAGSGSPYTQLRNTTSLCTILHTGFLSMHVVHCVIASDNQVRTGVQKTNFYSQLSDCTC